MGILDWLNSHSSKVCEEKGNTEGTPVTYRGKFAVVTDTDPFSSKKSNSTLSVHIRYIDGTTDFAKPEELNKIATEKK